MMLEISVKKLNIRRAINFIVGVLFSVYSGMTISDELTDKYEKIVGIPVDKIPTNIPIEKVNTSDYYNNKSVFSVYGKNSLFNLIAKGS
jgi:hypothetical protein